MHRLTRALVLSALSIAALSTPRPASACSFIDEGDFFGELAVTPGWAATDVPIDSPVVLFTDSAAGFATMAQHTTFEVYEVREWSDDGRRGVPVPGTLVPGPRAGSLMWVSDAPLVPGMEYGVDYVVEGEFSGFGGGTRFTTSADRDATRRSSARADFRSLVVEPFEQAVFGECTDEEALDSCGFCEREQVDAEMRFEVRFEVAATPGDDEWLLMRTAVGVDEAEAAAILARMPYTDLQGDVHADVAAFDKWPGARVCGAVQVVDAFGAEVTFQLRCAVVPEPPPLEWQGDGSGGAGCSAAPGHPGRAWALLLLGLGRRRRSPTRA